MSTSLLHSLYEQKEQVGFTAGVHYSVLQFASWHNDGLKPRKEAAVQRVAVLWDRDHDERVLAVVEAMYLRGLLAPAIFIGEHKGSLTIVVRARAKRSLDLDLYQSAVAEIATPDGDSWVLEVHPFESRAEAVHTGSGQDQQYLDGIDAVWHLSGVHEISELHGRDDDE